MAVYMISDLHLGHPNIHEKFRKNFSSLWHHDNTICENILRTCGKRDTLYILGDVVVHKDSMPYFEQICDRVEYVHIILGNHDSGERKYSPSVTDLLSAGAHEVYGMKKYKKSWLTHAPIHESELRGRFNIHGHDHNGKLSKTNKNYYCVSCEELGYFPINYEKIEIALS